MIKKSYLLILLSGFVITDVWGTKESKEEEEEETPLTRKNDQPPPFTQADLIPKKDKQGLPKYSDKPFAWYAPTALAGGLLLNNLFSLKIKPACAFAAIGIAVSFFGQRYLNKSDEKRKQVIPGSEHSKEITQNFWWGAGLKSIGWVSVAFAVNGFANYALKNPLFFGMVQSLDKFVITPGFFNRAPELAQFFQNNHVMAAGVALLGVGLASNYFASKSKTSLGYPHK